MWFYENTTGGSSVDGVISLTEDVVADLLAITGPIEMDEYDKVLSAENFTDEVQMAVEVEYDREENQPKQTALSSGPLKDLAVAFTSPYPSSVRRKFYNSVYLLCRSFAFFTGYFFSVLASLFSEA